MKNDHILPLLKNLQRSHISFRSSLNSLSWLIFYVVFTFLIYTQLLQLPCHPYTILQTHQNVSPILSIVSSWVSRNQVFSPVTLVAPCTIMPLSRHFINIYWRNMWMNNECTLHHWSNSRHSDQKRTRDQSSKKSTNWFLGINRSWLPIFMSNYVGKDFDESYTRGNSL